MLVPANSVDYVFIDPPFGNNLPYAELNFLWEAWLRVFTNAAQDAVVSGTQEKGLSGLYPDDDLLSEGGLPTAETWSLG